MKLQRLRLLAFALLLGIGGCFTLDTPLSDPNTAEPDKALCGVWRPTRDDADSGFLFVGLGKDSGNVPRGLMRLVMPGFDRSTLRVDPGTPMCGFVTRIKEATYFNVLNDDDGKDLMSKPNYDVWAAKPVRRVTLMKYKMDGDTLTVWGGLDDDGYKRFAAKHGISDSKGLASYLEKAGDAELFPPDKDKLTFARVR